jgi:trimeric autotransporter adhesin
MIVSLVCLTSLPRVQAVVPPPDGGYPNFTTAEGQNALFSLTTGAANTAVGWSSLRSVTTGRFNTATGAGTLLFSTADANTALGAAALLFNTTGFDNTAVGAAALLNNTEGDFNTANGAFALSSNTTGNSNTANGLNALASNTTGGNNTANGDSALFSNTTGGNNTATGLSALLRNILGGFNTANGVSALTSNTAGNNNVALGAFAGSQQTTGSNNVYIGALIPGVAGENDACYIASIFGQASSDGIPVLINANHKLGTTTSSKRFKEDIKPMGTVSEALYALEPVKFHYKKEIDPAGISQFGLLAEDVEKVDPHLIVRDKEGKPYSVRYDQVNAMLLNEFLKARRQIDAQQKQIEALAATVKEQALQIQKVSAQLEASKPAPQVAVNKP